MAKGFKMGKYRTLRKLKCLRWTKTAMAASHCPIVARIDLTTFDVSHRIEITTGMDALPTRRPCSASILKPDTS